MFFLVEDYFQSEMISLQVVSHKKDVVTNELQHYYAE